MVPRLLCAAQRPSNQTFPPDTPSDRQLHVPAFLVNDTEVVVRQGVLRDRDGLLSDIPGSPTPSPRGRCEYCRGCCAAQRPLDRDGLLSDTPESPTPSRRALCECAEVDVRRWRTRASDAVPSDTPGSLTPSPRALCECRQGCCVAQRPSDRDGLLSDTP